MMKPIKRNKNNTHLGFIQKSLQKNGLLYTLHIRKNG